MIEFGEGKSISLVDGLVDPNDRVDRDVYHEYLQAATRLADALCTESIEDVKRERELLPNKLAPKNVTIKKSRAFDYTTGRGDHIKLRFVKEENHDWEYPFAESVAMEVTGVEDSDGFEEVAHLYGNGINMRTKVLKYADILGGTVNHVGDIEEFVFAMRLALSEQLSAQT